MEWTPEKLRKVRALLDENSAVLVQFSDVEYAASNGQGAAKRKYRKKLVRRWPRISDGNRAICEAYLAEYGSAANTEPSRTVTDPKADREIYAGTWRKTRNDLSRIRTDPQEQGVYQTLLFPADASDGPDGTYSAEETHLNHVHVVASTGDAPAGIACQVPAKGKRLSVTAHLDKESGEWESEVRTDEARQEKWEHTDGDAFSTTRHIRKEHAKVLSFPAPAPGKIVRTHADIDEYGTYRTQADETTAKQKSTGPYTASKTPLQTVTAEEVRNAPSIPAAGDNETVSARVNEFGLYDVEKRTTNPVETPIEYTASETALEKTVEKSVRNAASAPNAAPGETVSARLNELGKVDYDKRTTTPKTADATVEAREWTEKTVTQWYRNKDAEQESIPGKGGPNAITTGGHAQPNEHGNFDGSVQITDPIERESSEVTVENGPLRKTTSKFHFNKSAVPPASVSGGTAITLHPRVNRFGLWDYEERKTSAGTKGAWKKPTCTEWWTEKVYTLDFRNWTDVPGKSDFGASDPLASYGVLSGHNVNLNDLGLFDGSVQLTVPIERHTDEITIEDSDQRTITVKNYFNQRTAPVNRPQTTSLGGNKAITTINARPNRFGLWDYEERTVTYKKADGTEYVSEEAFFESATTQQKLNQPAPARAELQDGKIQTVHNRLNDAGSYDTEKRIETARAKNTGEITIEDNPERKVTVEHFYNQRTKPSNVPTFSASGSNVVETSYSGLQLNRFGLWDYTKVKTTHKGGRGGDGNTSWSWTVKVAEGWGAYHKTSFPYKGRQIQLVDWRKWYRTATTTVKKHSSYTAAATELDRGSGNLLGASVTNGAHIESGGGGIFYSVKTTVSDVIWTGGNNNQSTT